MPPEIQNAPGRDNFARGNSTKCPFAVISCNCVISVISHHWGFTPPINIILGTDYDNGDVIELPQRTYTENIDFLGKAITLQSRDPYNPQVAAATIIEGTGTGDTVEFTVESGAGATLLGITMTCRYLLLMGCAYYKQLHNKKLPE